jgi:hypothetical protein
MVAAILLLSDIHAAFLLTSDALFRLHEHEDLASTTQGVEISEWIQNRITFFELHPCKRKAVDGSLAVLD